MLTISLKNAEVIRKILEIAGYTELEQENELKRFEESLLEVFEGNVYKKLPANEREEVAKLINGKDRIRLTDKINYLFNADELKRLFEKTTIQFFKGWLEVIRQGMTDEQKKKLIEKFKMEALRG